MKKSIETTAIIVALILTSSIAISATNKASIEKNSRESIRREITSRITCPDFIQTNDPANQVKAIVKVDTGGNITVEEINSANPQLQAYVINQLQSMKLNHPGESQKFVLVINFEVD